MTTTIKPGHKSMTLKGMELREGQVTQLGSTERVRRLSAAFHKFRPSICLHRARAYTQVFKETEGEPASIRRAKAFARTLEILPAIILDDELIVGYQGCKPRCITVKPDVDTPWLKTQIDRLQQRDYDPYIVTEEETKEYKRKIVPYWEGKTLYDLWKKRCPEEISRKVYGTGYANVGAMMFQMGCHYNPDYEEIFREGLNGYKKVAQEKLRQLNPENSEDAGKEHFYKAIILVCEAIECYAKKYATKATELASKETNVERKRELEEIAEICCQVPHEAPRTFREAIQAFWFIQSLAYVEGTGPAISPGRFDQYMYPFLKSDTEKGILTGVQAQELVECLYLKMNGLMAFQDESTARFSAGYTPFNNLIVGGVDKYGRDASNELSYLCLNAMMEVKTPQPTLSVMLHTKAQEKFWMKVADLAALGLGQPPIYNLNTRRLSCMTLGYSLSEATNCYIGGCDEPRAVGNMQYGSAVSVWCNLPMSLEHVFTRGLKRTSDRGVQKEKLGLDTRDPRQFSTFEDFKEAVKKQIDYQITLGNTACHYAIQAAIENFALPYQSMLTKDCLEKGKDVIGGGARIYVEPGVSIIGLADVADSMAAVKKLVYDDKSVSMEELCLALETNFEGFEKLRQRLIKEAPKYGNDIDYVDDIAVEILDYTVNCVWSKRSIRGNRPTPCSAPAAAIIHHGQVVGALPNGRKASQPTADGFSPAPGMDISGPTGSDKVSHKAKSGQFEWKPV